MGLLDVFPVVNARLLELRAADGAQLPSFGLGRKDIFRLGGATRVIWVPVGGATSAADSRGGDEGTYNPGKLWTRRPLVEAHVWGKDEALTEELAADLVAALHDVLLASYRMISERWDAGDDSTTKHGAALILGVEMHVPWTRKPDTYAKVETIPISGEGVTP